MAVVEATKHTIESMVDKNDIVIIDFWAAWCAPCRQFEPVFAEASEKYDDIVFAKVNTEEEKEIAAHLSIRTIPTIMVFREATLVFAKPGTMTLTDIDNMIIEIKNLDINEVRKNKGMSE